MLHGSRQETRSRLAVVAHKLSDQYHVPWWTVYLDLKARWWIHLPRVPTARRRRPGTVVSQGVRASQDLLPMYGNGSFSSASRIPGTPCGYPVPLCLDLLSNLRYITRYIYLTIQTAQPLAPSHSSIRLKAEARLISPSPRPRPSHEISATAQTSPPSQH